MHSHFLKKLLRETLHFCGCWLFLKKWNNESVECSNMVINVTSPFVFNSPHRGLSCHKYRKKFFHHNILENLDIKSLFLPPVVIRVGAETMCNQITSIFSKEWHGTTLSMHLTKFRKSEKWKEIRNWSLLMKIISTVPKVLLFKTTDLYNIYLFSEYANN